jgi:hypothetical protein
MKSKNERALRQALHELGIRLRPNNASAEAIKAAKFFAASKRLYDNNNNKGGWETAEEKSNA